MDCAEVIVSEGSQKIQLDLKNDLLDDQQEIRFGPLTAFDLDSPQFVKVALL